MKLSESGMLFNLALITTTPPLNCLKEKLVNNLAGGGTNSSWPQILQACNMVTSHRNPILLWLRRTLQQLI
jgi:hypothetical protein